MFIIYGWGGVAESLGRGVFHCPACRCETEYHHQQMRTWIKIFFIPVVPLAAGQRFVECRNCKGTFVEAVLDLGRPVPAAPLNEGDFVLGKRGEYWYAGTITSKKFKKLQVQFDDGKEALLSRREVVPLEVLQEGDLIFARPAAGGEYRLGTIASFSDEHILMRFEDGSQEWATTENIRVLWGQ